MRTLVLIAFFVSGFTSLVLETLWVRLLTLVFGGTTLAIVTVLTAFMGGLALGSLVAGKMADRIKHHVMLYGILELCIAVYALALPFFIDLLPVVYRWLPESWPFLLVALIRFVLCILLLILPTTLMGATLPILSHFFVRRRTLIGFDVGILYSVNTFGAVTGTFVGGFFLLPMLGHHWTLWSVTGFLALVAVCMITLGRRLGPLSTNSTEETIEEDTEEADDMADFADEGSVSYDPATLHKVSLFCIAITGAAAMICQVIWSRTLAMVIGSSTYAFTLILTIFLIGLAGGALWGSWTSRRSWDIPTSWSLYMALTGLAVALGSFFMDRLPLFFISMAYDLPKHTSPITMFSLKALVAAIPIIIPTFLMGTFFPLALGIAAKRTDKEGVGRSVGQLYAANTLGSIIGSCATGFLIIPLLGLRGGLALCVVSYFACACWLTFQRRSEQRIPFAIVAIVGSIAVCALPSWHHGRMSLGMFRLSLLRNHPSFKDAVKPGNVLFYKEGVSATVAVEGNSMYRALKVNGKTDASNIGDRSTQIGVSFLPMLLHPKPKDVAIVGWGSGMSVGTALQFPVKHVTAIELERAVLQASYLFEPWNFSPQKDKRLRVLTNDGRNFLATTRNQYDIIVSVPSNPWMSGVANLFTTDYFSITSKRLKPGGIFCQWVQVYELSTRNILSILRSIRSVYPHVRLFEVELDSYDLLLMASHHPINMDLTVLQKRIMQTRFKTLRKHMKMKNAYDYLPRFLVGEKELDAYFKKQRIKIPLNTDAHNILEFTAPLDLVRQSSSNAGEKFRKALAHHGRQFEKYSTIGKGKGKTAAYWLNTIMAHLRYGSIGKAVSLFDKTKQLTQSHPDFAKVKRYKTLMDGKEQPPRLPPPPPKSDKKRYRLYHLLNQARLAYNKDKEEKCIYLLGEPETTKWFVDAYPHVLFYLGSCSRFSDDYIDALKYFEKFLQHPKVKVSWSRPQTTPKKPTTRPSQPLKR